MDERVFPEWEIPFFRKGMRSFWVFRIAAYGFLGIITVIVALSCVAAVHGPARRIREMAVTETINEL